MSTRPSRAWLGNALVLLLLALIGWALLIWRVNKMGADGRDLLRRTLAVALPAIAAFGLLFWQPSDQALVMPRRLSRLPGFDVASQVSAAAGWPATPSG